VPLTLPGSLYPSRISGAVMLFHANGSHILPSKGAGSNIPREKREPLQSRAAGTRLAKTLLKEVSILTSFGRAATRLNGPRT
jgi:hypothetical protein